MFKILFSSRFTKKKKFLQKRTRKSVSRYGEPIDSNNIKDYDSPKSVSIQFVFYYYMKWTSKKFYDCLIKS